MKSLEDLVYSERDGGRLHLLEDFIRAEIVICEDDSKEIEKRYGGYFKYKDDNIGNHIEELIGFIQDRQQADIAFMSIVFPEFASGKWTDVFDYLEVIEKESPRRYIYSLLKILAVFNTKELIDNDEYPKSGSPISERNLFDEIYNRYQQASFYLQFERILYFDKSKFIKLWMLIYGRRIEAKPFEYSARVTEAIKILKNQHLKNEVILQMYYVSINANNNPNKDIMSFFNYYRKVYLQDENYHAKSPGLDYYITEEELNSVVKLWKGTKTLPFFHYLFFQNAHGNLAMEIETIIPILNNFIKKDSRILVIDPNPDLVLDYIKNVDANSQIYCAFSDKVVSWILKKREPRLQIYHYIAEESIAFAEPEEKLHRSKGNETLGRRGGPILLGVFDCVVYYARQSNEKSYVNFLQNIGNFLDRNNGDIIQFTPSSWIEKNINSISSGFSITNICFLPTEPFTEYPSKYVITKLAHTESVSKYVSMGNCFYYADCDGKAEIAAHSAKKRKKNAMIQGSLLYEPWELYVDRTVFDSDTGCSLKDLFEKNRPRSAALTKRETSYVEFSKEIKIWYSWSNGRGRYSYYAIPDKMQSRKGLSRGKCLYGPVAYTMKKLDEEKLKDKVFRSELSSIICQDIKQHYDNRPISLKTCWYCLRDELLKANDRHYNDKRMRKILSNSYIANMSSEEDIDIDKLLKNLRAMFPQDTSRQVTMALTQLDILFRRANNQARFLSQPVSRYIRENTRINKGLTQARSSLTKKTYTEDEEKQLIQFMKGKLKEDRTYMGALICFYTGMSNREAAALTWKDMVGIMGICQFRVYSIMNDEGQKQLIRTVNRDKYRRIPIVRELKEIIDEQRKYLLSVVQDKSLELKELPIVFKINAKSEIQFCKPADIKKAKDNAEKVLGLEPFVVSSQKKNKEDQTDFNEYQADRFRSNLGYRMLQTCLMSRAEANYILGLVQDNTFAKHYCDYTNDFVQIALKNKLERWSQNTINKDSISLEIEKIKKNHKITDNTIQRMEIDVDFLAAPYSADGSEVHIDITDNRGIDVTIYRTGGTYE